MTALERILALGEDSSRQFKVDVRNAESLASEMAAFANCDGGLLYIGVSDDGSTSGLAKSDVARINQLISNAASQLVRSPLSVQTRNVALRNGRVVVEVTVPKGLMPYHGIGSGIQRALAAWPRIEFRNDHDGCLFVATVRRDEVEDSHNAPENDPTHGQGNLTGSRGPGIKMSEKMSEKTPGRILELLSKDPLLTIADLSTSLKVSARTIERNLSSLQDSGRLRRIGPDKGGHWEVIS